MSLRGNFQFLFLDHDDSLPLSSCMCIYQTVEDKDEAGKSNAAFSGANST